MIVTYTPEELICNYFAIISRLELSSCPGLVMAVPRGFYVDITHKSDGNLPHPKTGKVVKNTTSSESISGETVLECSEKVKA